MKWEHGSGLLHKISLKMIIENSLNTVPIVIVKNYEEFLSKT